MQPSSDHLFSNVIMFNKQLMKRKKEVTGEENTKLENSPGEEGPSRFSGQPMMEGGEEEYEEGEDYDTVMR